MKLVDQLGQSWYEVLSDEIKKGYFRRLPKIISLERTKFNIYPSSENTFRAYRLCPYDEVKVVILGQDPYHGKGQANGLAFSINEEVELDEPPSLVNIFKEIEEDLGDDAFKIHHNPDLSRWSKQGVFLLNTSLTVREKQAGAHSKLWSRFTRATIANLNLSPAPIVFMLWGNHAKSFKPLIDGTHHKVLEAVHPSPLSANRGGWFGNKHFSQTNTFLNNQYGIEIDWK